jgi:hypothetical protein
MGGPFNLSRTYPVLASPPPSLGLHSLEGKPRGKQGLSGVGHVVSQEEKPNTQPCRPSWCLSGLTCS